MERFGFLTTATNAALRFNAAPYCHMEFTSVIAKHRKRTSSDDANTVRLSVNTQRLGARYAHGLNGGVTNWPQTHFES